MQGLNLDLEGLRHEIWQGANDALKGFLPELTSHIRRDVRIEIQQSTAKLTDEKYLSEDTVMSLTGSHPQDKRIGPPMQIFVEAPSPIPSDAPAPREVSKVANGKSYTSHQGLLPDNRRPQSPTKSLSGEPQANFRPKQLRRQESNVSAISMHTIKSKSEKANSASFGWTDHYPRSQLVAQALSLYKVDGDRLGHTPKPSPLPSPDPSEDGDFKSEQDAVTESEGSRTSEDRWASPTAVQAKKARSKPSLSSQHTFLSPMQSSPARKISSSKNSSSKNQYGGKHHSTLRAASAVWCKASTRIWQFRRRSWHIVSAPAFDYFVGFLLVLNAISNGVQVDHMARTHSQKLPWQLRLIEVIFCIIFATELSVRIFVHGPDFWVGHEWKWNWFDAVVVGLQILDELMSVVVDAVFGDLYASEYTNFALVRILRLVRLVRVLRFVRILRLVRELHVMVCSIAGSLRTFLWTCALFALMIYVVGVYFTQLVVDHRSANPEVFIEEPNLGKFFGSLGDSVLSLFQATSGGIDWNDLLEPLRNSVSPVMAFVLSAYIAFATLVMLNLVTGIFVDSARINIVEYKDLDLVNRVRELFVTSDENRSGYINWQEFERQLKNPQMEAYFKVLDLDISEAEGLFRLLDIHGTGEISSEDFVNGCLGLRGSAKAIDLKTLMFNSKRMFMLLVDSSQRIEDCLHEYSERMAAIEEKCNVFMDDRVVSSLR